MDITLPGLPEGIVAVRFGTQNAGEFIYARQRIVSCHGDVGLVVSPAEGYRFAFDMRQNAYVVVRDISGGREVTATFIFTNEADCQQALATFERLPGFASSSYYETEVPAKG
jgi:hypothetical protein